MSDYFEIDFLSVETKKSGDAIAIRYKSNEQTFIHVVDGGYTETGERLRDHIIEHYGNPLIIDNVVATHNDSDHATGLVSILEHFDVKNLWMLRPWKYAGELLPRFETYTDVDRLRNKLRSAYSNLAALEDIANKKKIPIRDPFQGARIGAFTVMTPTKGRYLDLIVTSNKTPEATVEASATADSLYETILKKMQSAVSYIRAAWGEEAFPAEDTSNENEMSVVQYAELCGKKILLTADTGKNGLKELIDYAPYIGLSLPGIDRFQVPHHGGRRNVNTELLDTIIGPRLEQKPDEGSFSAFISSAEADESHPRNVVVRALIHRGARLLTTEGKSIRTIGGIAPKREGWTTATPVVYPEEYEQ